MLHTHTQYCYIHIYIVLRFLLDTLSTFLDPFLDGLFCHNPRRVECSIEANIFIFDDPGAWLLQYPSLRYLDAVTDKFDCLGLRFGVLVRRVQFDTILVSEVCPPRFQIFAKI